MSGASINTLHRRVRYGGRKGRRAKIRLRERGCVLYTWVEITFNGVLLSRGPEGELWT